MTQDDPELIQAVLDGERDRFHDLVRRHAAPLLRTIRRHLSDVEAAGEVLQETWVRAFERLGDLREPARLRAWLVSIALNLVREQGRRLRPASLDEEGAPELSGESQDPGARMDQESLATALRDAIDRLPPRQRDVFDLRMNHELSHAEIAAHLGIAEEASRANYYQALKRLRDRFPEEPR